MLFITVGRKVECDWVQEPGTANVCSDWDFRAGAAHMVQNYQVSESTAAVTPMTSWRAMGTNSLDLYITRAGNYPFESILTFNTQTQPERHDRKVGDVNVAAPTVTPGVPEHHMFMIWPYLGPDGQEGAILRLGHIFNSPGFKIGATVHLPTVAGELDGGPGMVGFVQLVQCAYSYRTFDGRRMHYSTGTEYLLDETFPYMPAIDLVAMAPALPSVDDAPSLGLASAVVNMATVALSFKTYLMYKSNNPGSIWATLGRITWDCRGSAVRADERVEDWEVGENEVNVGPWVSTSELPTWTRNGSVINGLWDDEIRRVLTPEEYKNSSFLQMAEIKRRRNDYRPYVGSYNASLGKWEDYKRDFELHFDCVIAFAGDQNFKTWLLPEVAARARGYRSTFLNELAATAKWQQPRQGYNPPYGWETDWLLSVAPLCFAKPGEDSVYEYWCMFSNLRPETIAQALQAKLGRMKVTCDQAVGFGTFPVTFSRPLWEGDMRAIADLPFVFFMAPKHHFGDKYLNLMAYLPGHPQVFGREGYWVGEKGRGKVAGLNLDPMNSELTLEYMGHFANSGDSVWISDRHWLGGTEGDRGLEGFNIRLTGTARSKYNLSYRAYLHETGETGIVQGGDFCGTRGQNRPVEAIEIIISRKSGDDEILE